MQEILVSYAISAAAIFLFVTLAFDLSRMMGKRNDLADVAWGIGFMLIALTTFFLQWETNRASATSIITTLLVCIWGLRLATHIFRRFRKSHEDRRYREMQAKWGKHVELKSYLIVFLFQGFLMLLISAPVVIINTGHALFEPWMLVGVALWLVGFYFESVGDAQLSTFLANSANKGKLMTGGLWHYTRHPNYFGEIAQWWGITLIALFVPYGWIGLVGALTITSLILFVSGIPITEKHYAGRADWEAYKAKTSMLVPLPPKS